jgi:hypothetical protein
VHPGDPTRFPQQPVQQQSYPEPYLEDTRPVKSRAAVLESVMEIGQDAHRPGDSELCPWYCCSTRDIRSHVSSLVYIGRLNKMKTRLEAVLRAKSDSPNDDIEDVGGIIETAKRNIEYGNYSSWEQVHCEVNLTLDNVMKRYTATHDIYKCTRELKEEVSYTLYSIEHGIFCLFTRKLANLFMLRITVGSIIWRSSNNAQPATRRLL